MTTDWHARFIELAGHISTWSKDPSTQCGAVIVRPDKTVASVGFNGFPQGIPDDFNLLNEREEKLERVIHAEMNALLFLRERVVGYSMYVYPMLPCNRCAAHIIQAGISHVYYPDITVPHWEKAINISRELFLAAGIHMECVNVPDEWDDD